MRTARIALALVLATACGEKGSHQAPSPTPGPTPLPSPTPAPPAPAPSVKITSAWTWGEMPKAEVGPRMRDPNEPLPTGPAYLAAAKGKVVIATRDACVELLDGATGKAVVPHVCEKDAWALGLGIVGDVAIVARAKTLVAYSLADLKEVWRRDIGYIDTAPLARPGIVDGMFCAVVSRPQKLGVVCVDAANKLVTWEVPALSRIAFGDRRIGVVMSDMLHVPPGGIDLPVRFYGVDGKVAHETHMGGVYGPSFEEARPIFRLSGGGQQGAWTTRFVDADGADIMQVQTHDMLRGAAYIGGNVVTTEFGLGSKDRAVAMKPPNGDLVWRTELGTGGPWNPYIATVGGTLFVAHFSVVFALDASGKITDRFELSTEHRAVWRDRLLFLVDARESRSDSDYGDAALFVIDGPSHKLVFEDKVGTDIPAGQRANEPIFDGDLAFAIIGGRLHAYRVAAP